MSSIITGHSRLPPGPSGPPKKKLVYQRTRPSSSWQRDCWGRSHRKVRCWPAFVFKEPVRVQIRQGKGVYISPRQNWLDGITTAVRSACMLPLSVELSVGVSLLFYTLCSSCKTGWRKGSFSSSPFSSCRQVQQAASSVQSSADVCKLQEFGAILGHAIKRRLNHYR
jgi:hypothetical protein